MARIKLKPTVNYSLVVTVNPDGTNRPKASLINRWNNTSYTLDISKQCLQKIVQEKVALMKLVRYDYSEHALGTWIGANHVAIDLNLEEYKSVLRSMANDDSGKESEGKRQEDSGQIPLDL